MTRDPLFSRDGTAMEVSAAGPVDHVVRVPGSKSLTNRFLLLGSLSVGPCRIHNPLESEDTQHMRTALAALGVGLERRGRDWMVLPPQRWRAPNAPLFVGNAGTVMRFLAPALAVHSFPCVLTGNARMQARPIGDLVDGLRQLGVSVQHQGRPGYPPLLLQGPLRSGSVALRGDASSQYLSGMLMVLPLLSGNSTIHIKGELVSRTYVEMTLDCMARFGVSIPHDRRATSFRIEGGRQYRAEAVVVEPDASSASYWFALPLMVGGSVMVADVPQKSHQGDFGLLSIFREMGARVGVSEKGTSVSAAPLHGVDVDMNTMSDVAPTLAVVATRADSPTTIRNIANMRIKECDRIATLQKAFDLLGLKMTSGKDWIRVYPSHPTSRHTTLNPEEDHRMAMVFTLLGLAHGNIRIRDAGCVAKTYPSFYQDMSAALTLRDGG